MAKIPEEKLLTIMLTEGLLSQKQANACQLYQEEYFRKTGQEISLGTVLAKLEILPEDKVASIVRAMESANIPASAPSLLSREEDEEDPKASPRPKPRISLASLPSKHSKLKSFSAKEDEEDEEDEQYEEEKAPGPVRQSAGIASSKTQKSGSRSIDGKKLAFGLFFITFRRLFRCSPTLSTLLPHRDSLYVDPRFFLGWE